MLKYLFILVLLPSIVCSQNKIDDIEIQVVTISPGQYYWEAFGHSAIRIKTSSYDYIYGFGYFDFEDENFFLNFAKGEMQYYLGVQPADYEMFRYKSQGREVKLQSLNLPTASKYEIAEELNSLNNDEDRYYSYDYFENNCTSRIRDIINTNSDHQLFEKFSGLNTSKSLFDATFPVPNQAWINLAFAIGYGLPAYETKNQWQLSVFPEQFSQDIDTRIEAVNLIQSTQIWYQPNEYELNLAQKSLLKSHYAIAIILLVLILLAWINKTRSFAINLWLVLQSTIGMILLLLWFFSKHQIAAVNINVLLFLPFAFMFIFDKYRKSKLIHIFFFVNVAWLLLAAVFTSYYLIGFAFLNLLIWYRFKQSH